MSLHNYAKERPILIMIVLKLPLFSKKPKTLSITHSFILNLILPYVLKKFWSFFSRIQSSRQYSIVLYSIKDFWFDVTSVTAANVKKKCIILVVLIWVNHLMFSVTKNWIWLVGLKKRNLMFSITRQDWKYCSFLSLWSMINYWAWCKMLQR